MRRSMQQQQQQQKRQQKRQRCGDMEPAEPPRHEKKNPWLAASDDAGNDNKVSGTITPIILQWMLVFVDYNNNKNNTNNNNTNTEQQSMSLFQQAVVGLIQVLADAAETQDEENGKDGEKNSNRRRDDTVPATNTTSSYASTDIARLLFPWALQRVQKLLILPSPDNKDTTLGIGVSEDHCWRALRLSLQHLLTTTTSQGGGKASSSSSSSSSTPTLTQSTLFKLIPRLIRLALKENHDDNDTKQLQASQVFQLVMKHALYTPTLDVAVETVLLPLVQNAYTVSKNYDCHHHNETSGQKQQQGSTTSTKMLQATLQWIRQRLLRYGSPRTNFGVLARPAVVLALSRIHGDCSHNSFDDDHDDNNNGPCACQVVRDIVYHGLVEPQHHMDGFKSISVSASFACYQNDLLHAIAATLLPRDENNDDDDDDSSGNTNKDSHNNICGMVSFLPVLLHQFLKASCVWYNAQATKSKNRAPPLSALQFTVMERLAAPLLEALQKQQSSKSMNQYSSRIVIVTVGLRSLREMLDLVDEFQAYVPAHDTKEQAQFQFLSQVAAFVIQLSIHVSENDSLVSFGLEQQHTDTIMLVTRLIKLNHLLWRGQWPAILRLTLQQPGDARLRSLACTLWCEATETFTQLRQVDEWISVLFNVMDQLEYDKQANVLAGILTEKSFERVLVSHVRSCPVKQIPVVFSCIQKMLNLSKPSVVVAAVRPLVTTLLQSFQVNPGTADTVSVSLHDLVTNPLEEMVKSNNSAVQRVGMEACGWCIDLSMRCAFWLGPCAQVSVPFSLRTAIKQSGDTDELLLVMAHRLRQLTSLLHETSLSQVRQESSSTEQLRCLEKEAKQLTTKLYERAQNMSTGRGWLLIAQFLHFWIPFADHDQLDGFLGWLLAVVSLDSLSVVPPQFFVPLGEIEQQQDIAQSLFRDQAFHEIQSVSERLPVVAVKVAAQWITLALSEGPGHRKSTKITQLADVDAILSFKEYEFIAAWDSVDVKSDPPSVGRDTAEQRLCCAIETIKLLNGLPCVELGNHPTLLLALLYLDRLVCDRFLNRLDTRFYLTAVTLSTCLRKSLSRGLSLTRGSMITSVLTFLRESVGHCSLSLPSNSPMEEDGVYFQVTAALVEVLLVNAPLEIFSQDSTTLRQWFDILLTGTDEIISDDELDSSKDSDLGGEMAFAFCVSDILFIQHTFFALSEKQDARSFETIGFAEGVIKYYSHYIGKTCGSSWADAIVCSILAESLLYSMETQGVSLARTSLRDELVQVCLRSISTGTETKRYLQVLLTLLAPKNSISDSLSSRILQTILTLDVGEMFVPAIVSSCLPLISDDNFASFIESLIRDGNQGIRTRILLARLLFVESFLSEDSAPRLNDNKDNILEFALNAMLRVNSGTNDAASRAIDVWVQAVQSGHAVKREKLIVLVGSIPQVLREGGKSTSLYMSCARLLALLLQRYSKHLSTCAPVVILALQSFLRQIIDLQLTGDEVSLRARHWTRLCEILVAQKEVYKKHLVHIVLESLRAVDDVNLKQALMPGWMHLLDAFSPAYELKQLNALMEDATTKMLFRPIYEQYKRHNVYHGN